jgi:hypothetical protein
VFRPNGRSTVDPTERSSTGRIDVRYSRDFRFAGIVGPGGISSRLGSRSSPMDVRPEAARVERRRIADSFASAKNRRNIFLSPLLIGATRSVRRQNGWSPISLSRASKIGKHVRRLLLRDGERGEKSTAYNRDDGDECRICRFLRGS